MTMRLFTRPWLLAFLIATCSCSLQNTPTLVGGARAPAQSLQLPIDQPLLVPDKKAKWGVHLWALDSLSDGLNGFGETYCETGSPSPCKRYAYGLRHYGYKVSQSFSDPSYGSVSATDADSVELGRMSFSRTETACCGPGIGSIHVYAQDLSYLGWTDVLTPTSNSLPTGTPVTYKVILDVKPAVFNAACLYEFSQESLSVVAPGDDGGSGPSGQLEVVGNCEGMYPSQPETFVFRLHAEYYGRIGTRDVGTLTGYIGTPIKISSLGNFNNQLCVYNAFGYCPGSYSDALAGKVTYSIKAITQGASFETASGYRYP